MRKSKPVDTYFYSGPFQVGKFENYLSKLLTHDCFLHARSFMC